MSSDAFDRRMFFNKEFPSSASLNLLQTQADATIRDLMRDMYAARTDGITSGTPFATPVTGFIGAGFMPYAVSGMTIGLKRGFGWVYNNTSPSSGLFSLSGLNDLSDYKPLVLGANLGITVPANAGVDERIDRIEVKPTYSTADSESVQQLSGTSKVTTTRDTTFTWLLDGQFGYASAPGASTAGISYVEGTAGAGVPAATTGYVTVALVYVAAGAVTLTDGELSDVRHNLLLPQQGVKISTYMNTGASGGLVAALTKVHAPAGVRACVFDNSAAAKSQYDVYIVSSLLSSSSAPAPIATVSVSPGVFASPDEIVVPEVSCEVVALDATTAADIAAAAPDPITPHDVGLYCYRVSVRHHRVLNTAGAISIDYAPSRHYYSNLHITFPSEVS